MNDRCFGGPIARLETQHQNGLVIHMSETRPQPPPLPIGKGKRRFLTDIDGRKQPFVILDEIRRIQSTDPNKAIYLQKVRFEGDGRIELRLAYYIIGKKPRMAGRWVFGQYATLMPIDDFRLIIQEAERRGWI